MMIKSFLPLLLIVIYAATIASLVLIYNERRTSMMDSEGTRKLRVKELRKTAHR